MSIVTQNVWFEPVHEEVRSAALLRRLRDSDADIICLQEVTHGLLQKLQESQWVRDEVMIAVSSAVYGGYGCAVLARLPISNAWELELPSIMARSLVAVECAGLVVATVHLESTRALAASRVAQLDVIFEAFGSREDVLLTGDFNFAPTDPEEASVDPSFVDVWPWLRDDPGYTEDTTRNTMRRIHTGRDKHVRYDRILLRSRSWKPLGVELFADEPIGDDLFVSDHFGVAADLACAE